jgi:hypothetical protein
MDFNPDYLAFAFLVICVASTFASHMLAEGAKPKGSQGKPEKKDENGKYSHLFAHEARLKEVETSHTSKSLRKAYRKNWAERILGTKAYPEIREIIRNLIMTNVALLSAVLISFGLLISGFSVLKEVGGETAELKMVSMSTLLLYSLFMLISESRILNYVPILIWVDAEIIASMQKEEKVEYIAQLMDEAFDCFSNSLRALFFAVVCVFWFFNLTAFIVATALLTVVIVSSDFDKKIRISIF